LSRLFDRLKNAARLRGRAGADQSLLAQALRRAAEERAQLRAANGPPASDSASEQSTGSKIDDEDWAKSLTAPDDVDSRVVAAMRERANRDARNSAMRPLRSRVARGIAGALALVALVTLVVISLHLAQAPPAPVPVFQLDKTLR
jgi:hypothetical protein